MIRWSAFPIWGSMYAIHARLTWCGREFWHEKYVRPEAIARAEQGNTGELLGIIGYMRIALLREAEVW